MKRPNGDLFLNFQFLVGNNGLMPYCWRDSWFLSLNSNPARAVHGGRAEGKPRIMRWTYLIFMPQPTHGSSCRWWLHPMSPISMALLRNSGLDQHLQSPLDSLLAF